MSNRQKSDSVNLSQGVAGGENSKFSQEIIYQVKNTITISNMCYAVQKKHVLVTMMYDLFYPTTSHQFCQSKIIVEQNWVAIYGGEQKKVSGSMAQKYQRANQKQGCKPKVKEK